MAGLEFADLQSRPTEFLDVTSLTLDEFQERFTRLHLPLIIFAQAALPPQPAQRAFHNPAPRSHDKPLHVRRRCDDLQPPGAFGRTPDRERLSTIGAISPDQLQARLQRLEPDEQASCPVSFPKIRS